MKYLITILLLSMLVVAGDFNPGMSAYAGYRYDDVRMCVASSAGEKGGPVADVALLLQWDYDTHGFGIKVPIFRPVMFGIAFQMLQFEPEVYLTIPLGEEKKWSVTPGLGVVTHYGPGYKYDLDNRGEEFWAFGPLVTFAAAYNFVPKEGGGALKTVGLRTFIAPLWGQEANSESNDGLTAGAAVEFTLVRRN